MKEKIKVVFNNFIEDENAKTKSYFSKNDFGVITQEDIRHIIKLGKKGQDTVRLSLHSSSSSLLQLMLIYHPYKKDIPIQKFIKQESIYMLVDGEFKIELLNNKYEITSESYFSSDKVSMCIVPKNEFYKMSILSESLLFIEVRTGPYEKNNQILI